MPTRVIACGALAREIMALQRHNGLDQLVVRCLPAILHNHPERIAAALEKELVEARAGGVDEILIGYADCGTGGAVERLACQYGARFLPGAHCYAFFAGVETFGAWDEMDAFYLTDFLALQFEAFVVRPLKLDRHPELIVMMFGNYEKLVYLSQAEPPPCLDEAREAARFLGLRFEHRPTGYGALASAIQYDVSASEASA